MNDKTTGNIRWYHTGLVLVLIIAVAVLIVTVFKMKAQLVSLNRSGAAAAGVVASREDLSGKADSASAPMANSDKSKKDSDLQNNKDDLFDLDDKWYATPFDSDKWDPFAEINRMQTNMNRMFDNALGHFTQSKKYRELVRAPLFSPEMDVRDEKGKYVITVDLPGVKKENIKVNLDGQKVTISGKRDTVSEKKDENGEIIQKERRTGEFTRTLELPEQVDQAKMETTFDNGVYTIVLPKRGK